MTHSELYVGDAGGLDMQHMGHKITIEDSEGTSYEGVLSYLSFDLTRNEDEAVTVAIAVNDDPMDDKVFHLSLTHRVVAEFCSD